jgi:hypothetical protein
MNQRFHALQELGEQFEHAIATTPSRTVRARFSLTGRRLWAAAGASGVTLVAGVVAVVLSLSSGVTPAYAGWSSTPNTATPAAIAASASMCNNAFTNGRSSTPIEEFPGQSVLSESRGIYTAVINTSDGKVYDCLTSGTMSNHTSWSVSSHTFGPIQAAPGPDLISAPYTRQGGMGAGRGQNPVSRAIQNLPFQQRATAGLRHISGGGYGDAILGQAGTDVSAITLNFANGDTVDATVQNGWYFAWWPWLTNPTSVQVTTSSGAITSPMTDSRNSTNDPAPACNPGTSGCVFAATATTPSTTPAGP